MVPGFLVALLYYLCFLLLFGLTAFVLCCCPRSPERRAFGILMLSVFAWQVTLFIEVRTGNTTVQLWLGRANFAAVVWAAFSCWRLVGAVARNSVAPCRRWLIAPSPVVFSAVTLTTPLVCAAERVEAGSAITTYGPLFPVYLLYVLGFFGVAVLQAFRLRAGIGDRTARKHLTLIGTGILVTSGISAVTNAFLPYLYGNFHYSDVGTLSVYAFLLAVAYAVFVHRLFDARFLIRETLVYGILLAFVLGAYSSAAFVVTQWLTENTGADKFIQFVVLFIAFSFDPLRRFLEKKTDRLLFGEDYRKAMTRGKVRKKGNRRKQNIGGESPGRLLAIMFPWRTR